MFSLGRFAPIGGLSTAQFGTFDEGILSLTPQDMTNSQAASFDFCTLSLTPQDMTGQSVHVFDWATLNLTGQEVDVFPGPVLVDFEDGPTLTFTPQDIQIPVSLTEGTFDFATMTLEPQDFSHLVGILVGWPGDVVMLGNGSLRIATNKGILRVVMGTSGRNYAEVTDDGTGQ